jgi:predicted glycogen debranching enzyme
VEAINMKFGISDWRTYEQGTGREWLLTNGIGGYAASTLILSNTRRYHGLLVASFRPPGDRHLILSKIDESIEIDSQTFNLSSFKTGDFVMKGWHYLQKAEFEPLPCFTYLAGGVLVEKKVCLIFGENTVLLQYRIINGRDLPAVMRLTPLINYRDHHHTSKSYHMKFEDRAFEKGVEIIPYGLDRTIVTACSEGTYNSAFDSWFRGMRYSIEEERGLEAFEDHHIPGSFDVQIEKGSEKVIHIICSTEKRLTSNPAASMEKLFSNAQVMIGREEKRLVDLRQPAKYGDDEFAAALAAAADNFIVYRSSTKAKTIIAGYPWFSDWGRDAMIALPGLTLVTGRFGDAEEILRTFSKYERQGLIPNMFPEGNDDPLYNSVDAALWYFEAIGKYLRYTGGYEFIKNTLYPSMQEIIESFKNGTINKIFVDSDGLVSAGDEGMQLTWMDAKVGSWVVTPRHGKAVEINALWYNALKLMEKLADHFGEDSSGYSADAAKTAGTFEAKFWNEEQGCLYDAINGDFRDSSIRPNQIMAVSLLYPILEGDKAKSVVDKVWKELYTPFGLKTLSSGSPDYRGIYLGDQYNRDGAYHQGTVWAWLLGHFVSAFIKVYGTEGKYGEHAKAFLEPFRDHLRDAGIGSVSEIFDGDAPHYPRGCFAQAWSVAEILRCYMEDLRQI